MKVLVASAVVAMACGWPATKTVKGPTTYVARYVTCHDGDTCTFDIDLENETKALGLNITRRTMTTMRAPVRFCGVDAPELAAPGGPASLNAVNARLQSAKNITLDVFGYEKYGRILARVWADDVNLNAKLLEQQLAVPYGECK